MRKPFLIIIICIASLSDLSAQNNEPSPKRFGFKIGINHSLMNFNKSYSPPSPAVENTWKTGFNVGFSLQIPINQYLTLQPEYAYAHMSGEDERIKASYNFNYLALPVLLKISLTKRIAVIAGPEFDLLLTANKKEMGKETSIEHESEERNLAGVIGVEVKIIKSIYVDARYVQGFNHIGLNDRSTVTEFKWAGIALNVGVRF